MGKGSGVDGDGCWCGVEMVCGAWLMMWMLIAMDAKSMWQDRSCVFIFMYSDRDLFDWVA